MNMSFVCMTSLFEKDLLAPLLKNATKFVVQGLNIKEIKSELAAYAYQPVRIYFGSAGSTGVFEEWKYKNLPKTYERLPIGLRHPRQHAAMQYAVKRHNLKMGTQLEIVDLKKRGNIIASDGRLCVRVSSMFVKDDQGKCKELASSVTEKDGKFVSARPLFASSLR